MREVLSVRSKPDDSPFHCRDEPFEAWTGELKNLPCLLNVQKTARVLRVEYTAGYRPDEVPPDLAQLLLLRGIALSLSRGITSGTERRKSALRAT